MQRILVVGPGGSGKSTLATRIAAIAGLPVIHLDSEYWQPGWVEPAKADWVAKVDTLLVRDRWIMDGNYSGTLERRASFADTIVFLDFPRRITIPRVIHRWWQHRGRTRADMAAGCNEQVPLQFLWWLWRYPARSRDKVMTVLRKHEKQKRVVILSSPTEVETFVAQLAAQSGVGAIGREL